MSNVLGICLRPTGLGFVSSSGLRGQYELKAIARQRVTGFAAAPAPALAELYNYVDAVLLGKQSFDRLAVEMVQYRVNARGYSEVDAISRMIGVVMAASAKHRIPVLEMMPDDVSRMAIGKVGADSESYLRSAGDNGVVLKNGLIAEAYWVMTLGMKG